MLRIIALERLYVKLRYCVTENTISFIIQSKEQAKCIHAIYNRNETM